MSPDSFPEDLPAERRTDTATIAEVTTEMMEEAAHKAVEALVPHPDVEHAAADAASLPDRPAQEAVHESGEATVSTPSPPERDAAAAEDDRPAWVVEDVIAAPAVAASAVEAASLAGAETVMGPMAGIAERIEPASAGPDTAMAPTVERFDEAPDRHRPTPAVALGAYQAKVVEIVATNMAATSHFLTALMGATSIGEVVALNNDHLRRQVELLTSQGRELSTLAQTFAYGALQPFGGSLANPSNGP